MHKRYSHASLPPSSAQVPRNPMIAVHHGLLSLEHPRSAAPKFFQNQVTALHTRRHLQAQLGSRVRCDRYITSCSILASLVPARLYFLTHSILMNLLRSMSLQQPHSVG